MNEPTSLTLSQGVTTMSSREIAELIGKEISHVHRDIRAMLDALKDDPSLDHVREDKDARGYTTAYHLNRELTDTLLTGYSIPLRRKVVARWHELEAKAATPAPHNLSRMDILKLAMESEEARLKAEAERDHAIATKAQIGSRREATAMAAAAKMKTELVRLQSVLGQSVKVASVKAVEKLTKTRYEWRPLMRWCDENEVPVGKVFDEQYGQVNAYPAAAWLAAHGVDIKKIFSNIVPA